MNPSKDTGIITLSDIIAEFCKKKKIFFISLVIFLAIGAAVTLTHKGTYRLTQVMMLPHYISDGQLKPIVMPGHIRALFRTQVVPKVLAKQPANQLKIAEGMFDQLLSDHSTNEAKKPVTPSVYFSFVVDASKADIPYYRQLLSQSLVVLDQSLQPYFQYWQGNYQLREKQVQKSLAQAEAVVISRQKVFKVSDSNEVSGFGTGSIQAVEQIAYQNRVFNLQAQLNDLHLILISMDNNVKQVGSIVQSFSPVGLGRKSIALLAILLSFILSGIIVVVPLFLRGLV